MRKLEVERGAGERLAVDGGELGDEQLQRLALALVEEAAEGMDGGVGVESSVMGRGATGQARSRTSVTYIVTPLSHTRYAPIPHKTEGLVGLPLELHHHELQLLPRLHRPCMCRVPCAVRV